MRWASRKPREKEAKMSSDELEQMDALERAERGMGHASDDGEG